MNFGEQIKHIRAQQNITQAQLAEKLHISRQAVSNWENNKNLPDIELLLTLSRTFGVPLDALMTGEEPMNNMTEKIIRDAGETHRAKIKLAGIVVGAVLLLMGAMCIFIKANSVEYIDAQGFLHENFFLLPIGFAFLFGGLVSFAATGVYGLVAWWRARRA